MVSVVQRLWCVGKHALPLQPRVLDLVVVTGDGKQETLTSDAHFRMLPLKVSQYNTWLGRALKMPVRWWWQHGFDQPLIQEMFQAIPGSSKLAGVSKNMVVNIAVRGKEVMVLNNRKAVALAFGATTFDGQDLQ